MYKHECLYGFAEVLPNVLSVYIHDKQNNHIYENCVFVQIFSVLWIMSIFIAKGEWAKEVEKQH